MDYFNQSICKGSQPVFVPKARKTFGAGLLSESRAPKGKMLCVCAPYGAGKTDFGIAFSKAFYGFRGVYWFVGKSKKFMARVRNGKLESFLKEQDRESPEAKHLLVIDDIPEAESDDMDRILSLCERLMACNFEVLLLASPIAGYRMIMSLGAHPRRTINMITGESLDYRPNSMSVVNRNLRAFFDGSPDSDLMQIALMTILFSRGRFEDLERSIGFKAKDSNLVIMEKCFPFFGINAESKTFDMGQIDLKRYAEEIYVSMAQEAFAHYRRKITVRAAIIERCEELHDYAMRIGDIERAIDIDRFAQHVRSRYPAIEQKPASEGPREQNVRRKNSRRKVSSCHTENIGREDQQLQGNSAGWQPQDGNAGQQPKDDNADQQPQDDKADQQPQDENMDQQLQDENMDQQLQDDNPCWQPFDEGANRQPLGENTGRQPWDEGANRQLQGENADRTDRVDEYRWSESLGEGAGNCANAESAEAEDALSQRSFVVDTSIKLQDSADSGLKEQGASENEKRTVSQQLLIETRCESGLNGDASNIDSRFSNDSRQIGSDDGEVSRDDSGHVGADIAACGMRNDSIALREAMGHEAEIEMMGSHASLASQSDIENEEDDSSKRQGTEIASGYVISEKWRGGTRSAGLAGDTKADKMSGLMSKRTGLTSEANESVIRENELESDASGLAPENKLEDKISEDAGGKPRQDGEINRTIGGEVRLAGDAITLADVNNGSEAKRAATEDSGDVLRFMRIGELISDDMPDAAFLALGNQEECATDDLALEKSIAVSTASAASVPATSFDRDELGSLRALGLLGEDENDVVEQRDGARCTRDAGDKETFASIAHNEERTVFPRHDYTEDDEYAEPLRRNRAEEGNGGTSLRRGRADDGEYETSLRSDRADDGEYGMSPRGECTRDGEDRVSHSRECAEDYQNSVRTAISDAFATAHPTVMDEHGEQAGCTHGDDWNSRARDCKSYERDDDGDRDGGDGRQSIIRASRAKNADPMSHVTEHGDSAARLAVPSTAEKDDEGIHRVRRISFEEYPRMQVKLLGGFSVEIDGHVVDNSAWQRKKAKLLLVHLTLAAGHELSREYLIEQLWPDLSEERAKSCFYVTCSDLRKILRPCKGTPFAYIRNLGNLYSIDRRLVGSDVEQFERLVRGVAFDRTDDQQMIDRCQELIEIYRGDLLGGQRCDQHIEAVRIRYRDMYIETLRTNVYSLIKMGEHRKALWFAQKVMESGGMREESLRALMCAQAEMGQRSAAIETYVVLKKHLDEEYGIVPSRKTKRLFDLIVKEEDIEALFE